MKTFEPSSTFTQLREKIRQKGHQTGITIRVGMGTCSIAVGAREVLHALHQELSARQLAVHVTTTGCQGLCSEEPLLSVERPGEGVVTYRRVSPDKIPEITERHLIGGHPVTKWVLVQGQPGMQPPPLSHQNQRVSQG
jgi:(2Fe-2S) ferredoxin